MAKGCNSLLGCRNKMIFYKQVGNVFPANFQNMKEEKFDNETGGSVTLTLVNPFNFIIGVFKNGVRLESTEDYTIAGQVISFVEDLDDDNIVVIYF